MVKIGSEVVVRAYDLGGFGDIAGAMRVASFLQRTGLDAEIAATSDSALAKLRILNPDTPFKMKETDFQSRAIQLDIAGHYLDGRVDPNQDVPHNYTEDMDHPNDRRTVVPIYLKSGLQPVKTATPNTIHLGRYTPMFYRPFREWELPKSGERNVRAQIINALKRGKKSSNYLGITAERVLDSTDKIGFAHISPQQNIADIFHHPYFMGIKSAQHNSDKTFGVGLFLSEGIERVVNEHAKDINWNVVKRDGSIDHFNSDNPTLFFLGAQPQMTTTGLFLSSNIPNLVTGDLSLSDAIYGLIAMNGPAFYYETAPWKVPTHEALIRMAHRIDQSLANQYIVGSNYINLRDGATEQEKESFQKAVGPAVNNLIYTFMDEIATKNYTAGMRLAIRNEIRARFGDVPVSGEHETGGLYIPAGAPYLLQDATAMVVETLREEPGFFAETEKVRRMIAEGVPVRINVQTGVLESAPTVDPFVPLYSGHSNTIEEYTSPYSIFNLDPYKKHTKINSLEHIILGKKINMPEYKIPEEIISYGKKDFEEKLIISKYPASGEIYSLPSYFGGKGKKGKEYAEEYVIPSYFGN